MTTPTGFFPRAISKEGPKTAIRMQSDFRLSPSIERTAAALPGSETGDPNAVQHIAKRVGSKLR
jgi:hypothetical protein